MNPLCFAHLIIIFLCATILSGQTTINYVLNEENIHIAPTPFPIFGVHAPTDYSTIDKPLIAEPYATNVEINVEAGNIYSNAAGVADVFYGGDFPDNEAGGAPVPILTNQTFSESDFPILLECDFFSRFNSNLYNESYLLIIPSDYEYFGSSTYNFELNSEPREGLMIGGRPTLTFINNNFDVLIQSLTVQVSEHNVSDFDSWYNFQTVLDLVDGELFVRDTRVDGQCVFLNDKNMGPLDWLGDFRLGLSPDDLASNFSITTNHVFANVDFILPEQTCINQCIDMVNESFSVRCDDVISYEWLFPGANIENSFEENPTNICYANPGTYIVTLIATTSEGNLIESKNINVLAQAEVDLGQDTILCNAADFILDVANEHATSYSWQDGSTDSIYVVNESGTYSVSIGSECGVGVDEINIELIGSVYPPLLSSEQILCAGDTLILDATATNAEIYQWNDGTALPQLEVMTAGNYLVNVSNRCSATDFLIIVEKENCCPFYLPNAFSPNEDGYNDRFGALHSFVNCKNISDFDFRIYDRWGQVVFATTDLNAGWDGKIRDKKAQPATYAWSLFYNDGLDDHVERGEVTLIR